MGTHCINGFSTQMYKKIVKRCEQCMWEKYVEKSFYLGAKQMIGRNKDRHLKYKETDRMDQS